MKPDLTLGEQIDQAEQALMRRDDRLRRELALASRQTRQVAERGRWVAGGIAAVLGALLLRRLTRQHRLAHEPSSVRGVSPSAPAPAARTAGPPAWLGLALGVAPLLLPAGVDSPRLPPWLRLGHIAASLFQRSRARPARAGAPVPPAARARPPAVRREVDGSPSR